MNRKKLEALVWKNTHADFKGKRPDGTREVLCWVPSVGTTCLPLSSFTDRELLEKLPRRVRDEVQLECTLEVLTSEKDQNTAKV